VPPAFVDAQVVVSMRLGEPMLQIRSTVGEVIAVHRRRPPRSGALSRLDGHAADLERTVLAAFTNDKPLPAQGQPPAVRGRQGARPRSSPGFRSSDPYPSWSTWPATRS
jgi:hypothetical protein